MKSNKPSQFVGGPLEVLGLIVSVGIPVAAGLWLAHVKYLERFRFRRQRQETRGDPSEF